MLRMTFEFENTIADLDALLAAAATLRAVIVPPTPQPPANAPTAAWNVGAWFDHLGEGSRSFWRVAAEYARTNPSFTFDDLATASGTDKETLRSYQRNSYRAINAEANCPDPLESEWDAARGCNVYKMSDAVRDELLRLSATPTTTPVAANAAATAQPAATAT